jgi:predicted acyl esterase
MTAQVDRGALIRLEDADPELARLLLRPEPVVETPARYAESDVTEQTVMVAMRDGIRLATDLYLPPELPAPVIVRRTPYGRANARPRGLAFAQRGYVVAAQDVRGTGDSEPDVWDFWVYEPQDSVDVAEWVTQQPWFDGHLYANGASYSSSTQWTMAAHPRMTAIAPEMGGLQVGRWAGGRPHMFVNGYSRSVGKGSQRLDVTHHDIERVIHEETMAGGYANESLDLDPIPAAVLERYPDLAALPEPERRRQIWLRYCDAPPADGAALLHDLFGVEAFTYTELFKLPGLLRGAGLVGLLTIPSSDAETMCKKFNAPALIVTGWYDWNLWDQLPSWVALRTHSRPEVSERSRLIITPSAHNAPGYREGADEHPELRLPPRTELDLLVRWYEAIRDGTVDAWPRVSYYLMGANEWRIASDWPVPEAAPMRLHLRAGGGLTADAPDSSEPPVSYTYDPDDPTPTVGGSIVSYVIEPGSVDVSEVQQRSDVLTYTTGPLEHDLDVVGPMQLVLYASSSAKDTDFVARISDVFPDGRAIQLQNGMIRTRNRDAGGPSLLEPGAVYRFEIDMLSTANRFKAGHRLRIDISSADFPKFDRNSNLAGEPGKSVPAVQTVFHDAQHPSHVILPVLGEPLAPAGRS